MDKVNLIYGEGDVLQTHFNINPFAKQGEADNIIRDNVENLDKHVDGSELKELLAYDVIDYISLDKHEEVIENWASKIRFGGKIIIGGVDFFEVCKAFSQYKLGSLEANILIHGPQTKPYLIKRLSHTAVGLSEYLKQKFNFTILKKRISNYRMVVEAERRR